MHSWEVTCVDVAADGDPEDCAAIGDIGYLVARNVRRKPVDTAHVMVTQDHARWHVVVDGDCHDLEPVERDGVRYLRALDEDVPADPLLALPSIEEFERERREEERFGG